jgi:hypothetical protein
MKDTFLVNKISELTEQNSKLKRLLADACEQLSVCVDLLYALGHLQKDESMQQTELSKWYEEHKNSKHVKI